jgi:hypothetical protein
MFAVAVVAAVEIHDDGQDLAQGQGRLAGTLALAVVEQTLRVSEVQTPCKSHQYRRTER